MTVALDRKAVIKSKFTKNSHSVEVWEVMLAYILLLLTFLNLLLLLLDFLYLWRVELFHCLCVDNLSGLGNCVKLALLPFDISLLSRRRL